MLTYGILFETGWGAQPVKGIEKKQQISDFDQIVTGDK